MLSWQELLNQALNNPGSSANTYNRFYNYSMVNRMHMMFQGLNEPVATFNKWKELGRIVNKGEKAKYIIRPLFRKDKKDPKKTTLGGFKPVNCIFGVSQTSGDPLPEVEVEKWDKELALQQLNIKQIPFDYIDGNTQGFASKEGFAINPVAKYPIKTTFHELAHIVMNHVGDENTSKDVKEVSAESVAYILMHELELADKFNASESRNYIQTWLDKKPTDDIIKSVFKTVDKILNAGKAQRNENAEANISE